MYMHRHYIHAYTHTRMPSKAQKPQGDSSMSFPCVPCVTTTQTKAWDTPQQAPGAVARLFEIIGLKRRRTMLSFF